MWLPEGLWFDVCKDRLVKGDATVSGSYTLDDTPRFVKAGSVIPCYPHITNLKSCPERLILEVYPGADGSLTYYEDNGDDNGYQRGEFATTAMTHRQTDKSAALTILPRKGSYKGMPTSRTYEVVFKAVKRPTEVRLNGKAVAGKTWSYDEKTGDATVTIGGASFGKSYKVELRN